METIEHDWEKIDEKSNGLVVSLTYVVLFLNDQIYNFEMELSDCIKSSRYYRNEAKMILNKMNRNVSEYNRMVWRISASNSEAMALITQSMEDDIKPHIERFGYAVSQELHNIGCHGEINRLISLCSIVDMLCQATNIAIREFYLRTRCYTHLSNNPLNYLSMERLLYLTRRLISSLIPKDIYINLNELPNVVAAFQAIANNLLKTEVFERAFNLGETSNCAPVESSCFLNESI